MTNEEKAKELGYEKYPKNISYSTITETMQDYNYQYRKPFIDGALAMAEWKDSQCLDTLLRVFDLIANKRDAGEALEYIKKTLEFIIKDHYGDFDKNKINKVIMKSYCNLMCVGNNEHCISLAPCKDYDNFINIISEIDSKEDKL